MRMTHLIVPIVSTSPPLAEQVRAAVAAGATLIELRVDVIDDLAAVEALLREPRTIPIVLTIRSVEEGGLWDGDDAERVALIERLGLLLPGFVDVEFATWQRSANLRQKIGLVCEVDWNSADRDAADQSRDPDQSRDRKGAVEDPVGSKKEELNVADVRQPLPHGRGSDQNSDQNRDRKRTILGEPSDVGRVRNQLILSHHNWRETPDDGALQALFDELGAAPAAVAKAVFTARDATDSLRVLEQLRRRGPTRSLIALAMGEAGIATRVLATKFGAFGTFATLDDSRASAPGQVTIETLRGLYRWDDIGPATKVYGVVGWPVSHSKSPLIHNAAMKADNIDGVYLPFPVGPTYEDFAAFMDYVAGHPELDIHGLSVTIPHKEHALRWLEERGVWPDATNAAGMVNTLSLGEGQWRGSNTDGDGFLKALLDEARIGFDDLMSRRISVIGAGGVARAVVFALRKARLTVFNRTEDRAFRLMLDLGVPCGSWKDRVETPADVIVNCTSIGMAPNVDELPVSVEALQAGQIVFDTVYTPRETRFLREAKARGCIAISGVEMFLNQAEMQYQIFHSRGPRMNLMRGALGNM